MAALSVMGPGTGQAGHWGPCILLTMSPRRAGTQAASSMQRVQNYTRGLLLGLHQPEHHKAAAINGTCSEPGPPSPAQPRTGV